ncbi:MAG: 50S ribosomal protein L29 [Planctomycetes bacterium RBG_16_64_12]|nr:MAG: 50S ribosomal protein L29 [Planctomycetes bacterium RBG_16_64_12]
MAKASELREMSDEQLAVTLKETTESLFRLRLQAQTERLDAPSELHKHRQLIARIKTVQHERVRAADQREEKPEGHEEM